MTVLAILFMLIATLVLLFLHGHDKGRETPRTLQIIAILLLVINSAMLLVSTAEFVDQLITTRLLLKGSAAFLLALSFFLELKHITEAEKKTKKPAKKKQAKKQTKKK